MKNDQTIFYDIDTQLDFIALDGKFHVEGAETIGPKLKALTDLAHEQKVRIVCSVDRHVPGDPMLKSWGGPYPDHCLAGTPGEQKIPETKPVNPLYLENKEYTPEEIQKVLDHKGEIIFQRQQFEALANNAHLRAILRLVLRPYSDIVIYGVYVEFCADREITALIGLGPKLHVVKDAVVCKGIEAKSFFEKWREAGVEIITFDELKLLILN
jgi:nicotinamidase-related amidase